MTMAAISRRDEGAGSERPALSINDLRKVFLTTSGRVVEAIRGISLDVREGEVVAVLGPSGCGKSSLLRILAGLDDHYGGHIDWALSEDEERKARQLRSATVFQADSTLPWMTVEKNVLVGMSGLGLPAAEAKERASRYLALVGLSDFSGGYPHELSGGMRQRVAIARALATEPLLLLMDEPLAALDAQTRLVMQQELLRIWEETRSTVIYVTHDISEALCLADRVLVMTARPGETKALIELPFQDETDAVEIRKRKEFGELEVTLWRMVAQEVGQTLSGTRNSDDSD